jgi:nucleotide-binding universal stress UspA family protein
MPTISRVLVPVDFSACSRAALEYALFLGERFGASIDVLHVWDRPHGVGPEFLIREPGGTEHPVLEDARDRAGVELDEFLSRVRPRENVHAVLDHGKPYNTILKVAAGGYDLIVMGTHGRSGLPHLLLGSVTEKVVRSARCPVLTIRRPETASEGAAAA